MATCSYLTPLLLYLTVHCEGSPWVQRGVEGVVVGGPDQPTASHALQPPGPCRAPLEGHAKCYHQEAGHCSSALAAQNPFLPAY